ncbi:MAG: DUF6263 family protein [Planctomycetota bacterium]
MIKKLKPTVKSLLNRSARPALVLACACLWGFAGVSSLSAQTKLTYKFQAGQKTNYVQDTEIKQSMSVAGQNIDTNIKQSMEVSQSVLGVEGTEASVQQTVSRFRTTMEMPGNNIEYDSKDGKKPDGPVGALIGPLFDAMVGTEISFKLSADGKMTNAKISEKLANALKANPILAQMGGAFSEDGLKGMMQQSSMTLPAESLTKGKSWTNQVEMKTPIGVTKLTTTYTYQGPEARDNVMLEKITTKSEMTIEPAANQDVKVKVKDTDIQGTIYFYNVAGRIVDSTQTQKITMEIAVMGQNLESKQTQTLKYKVLP